MNNSRSGPNVYVNKDVLFNYLSASALSIVDQRNAFPLFPNLFCLDFLLKWKSQ